MKNLLFIAAFMLSIASVKANYNASELSLELFKPGDYTIVIDGVVYPNVYKKLFVPNIDPGLHHIEAIKYINYGKYGKYACGYHVQKVMLCDRYVKIHPNTHVDAYINKYDDLVIGNTCALLKMPEPVIINNMAHVNNCAYDNCHATIEHMSYGEFQNLKNVIESKVYASDKKSIAMMAINNNYLMAEQTAQLVSLMPYESDKIDLAKAAYQKTINKEDYYLVNKEFGYSTSIDELEYYIYAHK